MEYSPCTYLGLLVKQARIEKGLTEQELADDLDMDIRTIQNIESGFSNPYFSTIKELIMRLDISPTIMFEMPRTDEGLKMDQIFRQLLALEYPHLEKLCNSAMHVRRWYDKNGRPSSAAE